jgi:translation initiation factor IF-3
MGLDLIEVSPNANPPVAKIADYGRFKYELQKKEKEVKAKTHVSETKTTQVKIGTGEHDMHLKASKSAEWLREGHRVKVDLFLWGRYKYMEFEFLKDRLERFLAIIPESYKIADEIKKSPKGLSVVLELDKSKKFSPKPSSTAVESKDLNAVQGAGNVATEASRADDDGDTGTLERSSASNT